MDFNEHGKSSFTQFLQSEVQECTVCFNNRCKGNGCKLFKNEKKKFAFAQGALRSVIVAPYPKRIIIIDLFLLLTCPEAPFGIFNVIALHSDAVLNWTKLQTL